MPSTPRRVLTCVAVVLSVLALAAQAPRTQGSATVIKAGTLLDPQRGVAERNQTILIEGGKVTRVGADVAAPAGAVVIDLSKYTVLPGLIDAHTHLCMDVNLRRDAGNYYLTTLYDPDSYRAVQGVANAKAMLEAGFTAVRDVGNEGRYACVSVRRGIDNGLVPGPTMLTAGRIIAPFGGQFQLQQDKPGLGEPEYFFADTRDEMRKAVRENVHFGARLIKIVVDDQAYVYSEDDIRFIIQEAAAAGVKVAAHVWTRAGAHNAAAAGPATLEHLNGISDEDLDVAKKNGVIAVFTPFPLASIQQSRDEATAREEFAKEIDRLRSAHRKGVPIAFGSDAIAELPGMNRGVTTLQWIDSYVAAGLTPKDIVASMTSIGARALGIERERGAIREGLAADIIATPGNPYEDVNVLKRVAFVMKDGRTIVSPP